MREGLRSSISMAVAIDPVELKTVNTVNPATEAISGNDCARVGQRTLTVLVQAARKAFTTVVEDQSRGAAQSPRAHPGRIIRTLRGSGRRGH